MAMISNIPVLWCAYDADISLGPSRGIWWNLRWELQNIVQKNNNQEMPVKQTFQHNVQQLPLHLHLRFPKICLRQICWETRSYPPSQRSGSVGRDSMGWFVDSMDSMTSLCALFSCFIMIFLWHLPQLEGIPVYRMEQTHRVPRIGLNDRINRLAYPLRPIVSRRNRWAPVMWRQLSRLQTSLA